MKIWYWLCRMGWVVRRWIEWAPVLAHNYEFDHAYLTYVIVFKLKRMADCFERDGHLFHTDRAALQIRRVIWLLERAEDVEYDQYKKPGYVDYFGVPWGVRRRTKKDQSDRYYAEAFRLMSRHYQTWWD